MRINHNISAVVSNDNLMANEDRLTTALERLSSGLKINSAKDNPTGMAMSIKMQAQIDGLNRAEDNAEDGISLIQTADGALNEVSEMLQRMRELAVQAANGTNSLQDRESIQLEVDALVEEIDRISKDTDFNGTAIFDGSMDTRVYTDTTGVTKVDVTAQVPKGNYQITVTENADYARIDAGVTTGSSNDFLVMDNTNAVGVSGTLTINDLSISITEADTQAEIYNKIRDCAENAGAAAEIAADGHLVFRAEEKGSDVSLEIGMDDDLKTFFGVNLVDGAGNASNNMTVVGKDVKAELGTGFRKTATAIGKGESLDIKDMSGFELVLKINEIALDSDIDGDGTADDKKVVGIDVTGMGTMTMQIGANKNQNMEVKIAEMSAEALGIDKLNYKNETSIGRAIEKLDAAISKVSNTRSSLGAYENRLEHTSASLSETVEDMTAALSRITDVDMAEEMSEYTNLQVLTQAGTSVLAQANQLPQQVLQMLQ